MRTEPLQVSPKSKNLSLEVLQSQKKTRSHIFFNKKTSTQKKKVQFLNNKTVLFSTSLSHFLFQVLSAVQNWPCTCAQPRPSRDCRRCSGCVAGRRSGSLRLKFRATVRCVKILQLICLVINDGNFCLG